MYIKSIDVTNFKSFIGYRRFEFSPKGNLIFGENGKGKSSLASLITFSLYGIELTGTDRTDHLMSLNEETKELIAKTTESTITIVLDDGTEHKINRIKNIKFSEVKYDGENIQQINLNKILGDEKLFLTIFTGEYFVNADENERRKLLNSVFPVINKQEVLMELLDKKYFEKYQINLSNDEVTRFKNLKSSIEKNILTNEIEIKRLYDILNEKNIVNDIDFNQTKFDELKIKLAKIQEDIKYNEKIKQNLLNIEKQKEFNNSIIEKNNKKQKEKEELEKLLLQLKENEFQKPLSDKLDFYKNELNKNEIYLLEIEKKIENINKIENKCPVCDNEISGDNLNNLLETYKNKKTEIKETILNLKLQIDNENKQYVNLSELYNEYYNKINNIENKIKNITFDNLIEIENVDTQFKEIPDVKNEIKLFKELHDIRDEYIKKEERIKIQKEEKAKAIDLINEKAKNVENLKLELDEIQKIYKTIYKILPNEILKKQTEILSANLINTEIMLFKRLKTTNETKECCSVFYKGKPYNSISRSEKIFCCHEISEMFTKLSKKTYPIFIDNSECIADINRLIKKNYYKQFFITKVEKNTDLIIKFI